MKIWKKLIAAIILLLLFGSVLYIFQYFSFHNYISKTGDPMKIPINTNAPVIARDQIIIQAPVEKVWDVLTNISKWPDWQKAVTEARVSGDIQEGMEFRWKADGLTFQSKIHTCSPMVMFGWTGKTWGAYAIHNWYFTRKGNETLVTVEESLQGVFPWLFRNYFQKNLETGVKKNLEDLRAAAEK